MISMSNNTTSISMKYDAFGNRVSKAVAVAGVTTTTQYLVDDLNPTGYPQVVDELVGPIGSAAVQRTYTYGLQRISQDQLVSGWLLSYYQYDGGGSVRQLTNSIGQVTDSYEYDAFGNSFTKTGTTPNNYLYRGEQYDPDLGLYYLRARYYNPATGRFLSRDPEDGYANDPKSLHKYLYAGGDPVNGMDPTGRDEVEYGLTFALIDTAVLPELTALVGTAATNALAAAGVTDAIAAIQAAAEAGSYEEAIAGLQEAALQILRTKPLVRAFLCAPVGLAYKLAADQLDEYAAAHHWTWLEIKAMDKALDYGKSALVGVCTGYLAFGGK